MAIDAPQRRIKASHSRDAHPEGTPAILSGFWRVVSSPVFLLLHGVALGALTVVLLVQGRLGTSGMALAEPVGGILGGITLMLLAAVRWGTSRHSRGLSALRTLTWIFGLLFALAYVIDVFGPALSQG